MEKILAAGCSKEQLVLIRKIASDMKIRVTVIPKGQTDRTVDDFLSGKVLLTEDRTDALSDDAADGTNSLLVFNELTEKHFDRFLAKLREKQSGITYKAAVTPTNKSWSIAKLCLTMELEKRQMEQ